MADASAVEASRKRIESAGPRWFHVLNVSYNASAEDIKAAYRSLVLLHHPDKGGDADTFKKIRVANEQAMAKLAKTPPKPRAKTKAAAKSKAAASAASPSSAKTAAESRKRPPPTEAHPDAPPTTRRTSAAAAGEAKRKARPKAVPLSASKAKLRGAISKWENNSDPATKTMPDDITKCSADEVAEMILSKSCILVDTREENEEGSEEDPGIPGACQLPFGQVVTEPEQAVNELTRLIEEPKTLVLISEKGDRMARCGLLATLLVDVFGFDEAKLARLEGGVAALREVTERNASLKCHQQWLSASTAEVSAEVKLIEAKSNLKPWREGFDDHFQVLEQGTWSAEADVKSHLDSLASLFGILVSEESLKAMTPLAAQKKVGQRGVWDKKVMSELNERFQKKLQGLEKVTQDLEAQVAALKSTATAARKAFEESTGQAAGEEDAAPAASKSSEPAAAASPAASPPASGGDASPASSSPGAAAAAAPAGEEEAAEEGEAGADAGEAVGDEEMEDAAEGEEADPAAEGENEEEDDAELFADEGEEEEEAADGAEGDAPEAGDA